MDYIFERGKFTEDELEQAIIELFKQQGYDYILGENIHRQYEDILLLDTEYAHAGAFYHGGVRRKEAGKKLSEQHDRKNKGGAANCRQSHAQPQNAPAPWTAIRSFHSCRSDSPQECLLRPQVPTSP